MELLETVPPTENAIRYCSDLAKYVPFSAIIGLRHCERDRLFGEMGVISVLQREMYCFNPFHLFRIDFLGAVETIGRILNVGLQPVCW